MLSPNRDGNIVAKGLELMLTKKNPAQSYTHFSKALENILNDGDRNRSIQYRDAAAASMVRLELESGDNFAKLGRYGSALEVYSSIQSASSIPAMLQFQMLNNSGACLARLGRKSEALTKQLKALALNPSSTKTLKNIAILLADMGHYREAIQAFDAYLVVHPDSYSALCGKAGCLKDLRLFAQCDLVAEQAQLEDPKMLRGRCAHDIKELCRQELLKIQSGKEVENLVEENTEPLATYFSPSKSDNNGDFNFETWLESIKSGFGDKDIFEDYNLPQHSRADINPKRFLKEEPLVRSPIRSSTEKTMPISVSIPGNDLFVNGSPNKPHIYLESNYKRAQPKPEVRQSHSLPISPKLLRRSDYTSDIYMQPSSIEAKQSGIPATAFHHPVRPIKEVIASPKYSALSFSESRPNRTEPNDSKLRMKYPIRLGLKKEPTNPTITLPTPYHLHGPESDVPMPFSVSVITQETDHRELKGKQSCAALILSYSNFY